MNSSPVTWHIKPEKFPDQGDIQSKIRYLLRFAILAPSAHNTQPWKCKIIDTSVHIYFDQNHALGLSDPVHRQAYLSLGCFVTNLIVAAKAFNMKPKTTWLPEGESIINAAATIELYGINTAQYTEENTQGLKLILNRRVDRSRYNGVKIPIEDIILIKDIEHDKDLSIDIISDQQPIKKISRMVRVGMEFAFRNPKFRKELAEYVIPNSSTRNDGIPGHTANLGLLESLVMPHAIRQFDIGNSQGKKEEKLFLSSSSVIIVSSQTDDLYAWLRAGALYQQIALKLTELKISHAVSGAPIEAPLLPQKIQHLLGSDNRPQMLFRIGYSNSLANHSPRRGVSDILVP